MEMILVSFFADPKGTQYYSRKAKELAATCETYGIQHFIKELPTKENWLANTAQKPFFIREMIDAYGSFLWVDVDSRIGGDPTQLAAQTLDGVDVAFAGFGNTRARSFVPTHPLPVNPLQTPLRVMGIAHAWSNSSAAIALADQWCEMAEGKWGKVHGDHRLMQHSLDMLTIQDRIKYRYFPNPIGRGPLVKLGEAKGVPGRSQAMAATKRRMH